jgi:serine/threonine protein kinase
LSSQDTHDDSALLDFLLLWSEDEAAGATRPLAHYLARFPGHERAIESAFRARNERASARGASLERRIGPYLVLRELGRGGQGAVYLAEDTRDRRLVALKVLDSFAAWRSKERVERLRREASVVSRLQHPAICNVLDADLESDPPYLAMRMVDGRTLAHEIALARAQGDAPRLLPCAPRTRLELEGVLAFFDRAARALHSAHEAGVIHRDVKPGNIMVTPDGEPVLLDFGLARDSDSTQETLTHSGQLFGTPAYMAPERIGRPRAEVTRQCDVHSLGVTLYEVLTLARPFEGADPEALFRSIAHGAVPDARRTNAVVPYELQVVLATAMEKDARRRYATALELADELRRVREYEPIRARPTSAARKLLRWSQRHPAIAFTSSASFLLLAIGLLVSQHLLRQREEARRRLEGLSLGTLSLTLVEEDPTRSLLLAIESASIEREYYGDSALFAALAECREAKQFDFEGVICRSVDFDRQSRWAAFAGDGPKVEVRELASGRALPSLAGPHRLGDVRALRAGRRRARQRVARRARDRVGRGARAREARARRPHGRAALGRVQPRRKHDRHGFDRQDGAPLERRGRTTCCTYSPATKASSRARRSHRTVRAC